MTLSQQRPLVVDRRTNAWASGPAALGDEEVDDDGVVASRVYRGLKLRYTFRFEMEHLLARTGFEVEGLYGDCFGGAFEDSSPEMVWVARLSQ